MFNGQWQAVLPISGNLNISRDPGTPVRIPPSPKELNRWGSALEGVERKGKEEGEIAIPENNNKNDLRKTT